MKKFISLVGARPQFIKEAVFQEALKDYDVQEVLVNSGQHYNPNMADVFFRVLSIKKPEYDLHVGSGTHSEMTGKIMIEFEKVINKEIPDAIIVFGDTNTTLAGALVGAKCKVPVMHIEAGIRMKPHDMPEEINRVLVDKISYAMYCPSRKAVDNLAKEGITDRVYFVGDVMYDLFLKTRSHFDYSEYERHKLTGCEYYLFTLHRDYNVDNRTKLEKILSQIEILSKQRTVVFPIHPRTKKRIHEFNLEHYLHSTIVTEPLDYLMLMGLLMRCNGVITDSGGLQKEAYFAGKCASIIMPDTGWAELIDVGGSILCDENTIYDSIKNHRLINVDASIYGDGDAGEKIAHSIFDLIR